MDSTVDNQQKYENYRVQMGRLKSALRGHFYLEAIFIEYAIMEDRLEAILRHADKWHPKDGIFVSIDAKGKKVAEEDERMMKQLCNKTTFYRRALDKGKGYH